MQVTIEPQIRHRVEAALARLEAEQEISVILAVESGSRAWGFPSPDSDYDARFVYARPLNAYLSIEPPRDVIETPITDALDLNGWDLRKALQLLCKSNAVLIEWLTSPVRYRSRGNWPSQLLELARAASHLPSLEYHYDRLARRSFSGIETTEKVRFKDYCYALRAALALSWLRQRREPPPMDMPSLMSGAEAPADVVGAAESLIQAKAAAFEHELSPRLGVIDRFIAGVLQVEAIRPGRLEGGEEIVARANSLFSEVLHDLAKVRSFE
jgi:hypothetical protein